MSNLPRQQVMRQGPDFSEEEIDLAEYLGTLVDGRKVLVAVAGVVFLLGLLYAFLATPVYQADALIQVEQSSSGGALGDLADLMATETPAETEIEIIRSRSVIGKVVNRLGLDIDVEPHWFPLLGESVARSYEDEGPASAWLGLESFAWGGERIALSRMQVPVDYVGEPLTLEAGEQGSYRLLDDDGEQLLSGRVGEQAAAAGFGLFVRELVARPGTRFDLTKRSWLEEIGGVLDEMQVSEKGKKTGILQLTYNDTDAAQAMEVANAIANVYLKQNVERKSEEAQQALDFIDQQMPEVKAEMTAAETTMNEYRLKKGSVDLGMETQAILDQIVDLEKQKSALELQRAELSKKFTSKHPVMAALDAKATRLELDKSSLEKEVKSLPETEQQLLKLAQGVKVNQELYEFMLNKSQELKVAKAGTIGDVRILDYAVMPEKPIKPKKGMIIALSLVLGLFAGVVVVFVRKSLHQGIEDPEVIEKRLGLSVYAGIPHSNAQGQLYKTMRATKGQTPDGNLLALVDAADLAIESLRSLRTNLHFGLLEAKNNVVMLTGPAPDIGKSFVSINFAQVLGDSGQRVLLIDGDMRKGHLHEYIGGHRESGLSDVIGGQLSLAEAVQKTEGIGFDLLSTGTLPPNPAELLMHVRFGELLQQAAKQYDLILIDTPPVLAATDAVIIGKHTGTAFLLLRAGHHPLREIQQTLRQLEHGGVRIDGTIFNDIPERAGYGYSYHYQYAYKSEK